MDVSVIGTVLNEAGTIAPLIAGLERQSLQPREVVIVDGGSDDTTWEELQACAQRWPLLRIIQDESCNLAGSKGPIARGRNVAIASTTSDIIACVDAGCTYGEVWLARLTRRLREGSAEYALGGSCMDPGEGTTWDKAAAPFFGVSLRPDAPTKSCTARSMAFTRALWERAGGFDETTYLGEDTVFDLQARSLVTPDFVPDAKAVYRHRFSFQSALRAMRIYARYDGTLAIRPARFLRSALRCFAELAVLALLPWSVWPVLIVAALELWFAFARDAREVFALPPKIWVARVVFSLLVPWAVTLGMLQGMISKRGGPRPAAAARARGASPR